MQKKGETKTKKRMSKKGGAVCGETKGIRRKERDMVVEWNSAAGHQGKGDIQEMAEDKGGGR